MKVLPLESIKQSPIKVSVPDRVEEVPSFNRHLILSMRKILHQTLRNMPGIKETNELIDGLEKLAVEVIKQYKDDDAPAADALDLVMNEGLREEIAAAIEGVGSVSEELSDLDIDEQEALGIRGISLVSNIRRAAAIKPEK
jgi:hypothetical protein